MKSVFVILFFGLGLTNWASAQDSVVVEGKIVDKEYGDPLHAANVVLVKNDDAITGSITNDSGYYKIKAIPGQYNLRVEYIGYEVKTKSLQLKDNPTTVNFKSEKVKNPRALIHYNFYPPLIKLDGFTQGDIITNEEIMRLPLSK